MRYLAIARFRFLITIRTSTPVFVISILPPMVAAFAIGSVPETFFRADADMFMGYNARAAFFAWAAHAVILSVASLASGKIKRAQDPEDLEAIPDLMDTTPVSEEVRFWGEALGTIGAAAAIHVCCLPLLAAVGALSPLPTSFFATAELLVAALLILASTGAAWQHRAPRTKFAATRPHRSAAAFAILSLLALLASTRWEDFRDAALEFVTRPSPPMWRVVANAVENPLLLGVLLFLIYAGYIYYYFASATRKTARA